MTDQEIDQLVDEALPEVAAFAALMRRQQGGRENVNLPRVVLIDGDGLYPDQLLG